MEGLYSFLFNTTEGRVALLILCVAVIFIFIVRQWRRTSAYVDRRGKAFQLHRQNQKAYTERCKEDPRWPAFHDELQKRYPISMAEPIDSETYELFELNIANPRGQMFDPGQPGSEQVSMYAYLKRKTKPSYLQVEMSASGKVMERRLTRGQWYEYFERFM